MTTEVTEDDFDLTITEPFDEPKDNFNSAFIDLKSFFHREDDTCYVDAIQDLLHLADYYDHDVAEILKEAQAHHAETKAAWGQYEALRKNLPFKVVS